jgi:hypothetical protein
MRRPIGLAVSSLLVLAVACGEDPPNEFETASEEASGTATGTGSPTDVPLETGESGNMEAGDGDGDPTGDGDGDGDPTGDGDGDGDPSGDGDGDTGVPVCGNGVVDLGEQCDGAELGGITCADLGYSGGDLACDPVTCTYDASGCTAGNDNGSGGTTG